MNNLIIEPFEYDLNTLIPNNFGIAKKLWEIIEKHNRLVLYLNNKQKEDNIIEAEIEAEIEDSIPKEEPLL